MTTERGNSPSTCLHGARYLERLFALDDNAQVWMPVRAFMALMQGLGLLDAISAGQQLL